MTATRRLAGRPNPNRGPTVGTSFACPGSRLVRPTSSTSVIQFVIVAILAILAIVFAAIFFPLAIITSLGDHRRERRLLPVFLGTDRADARA